MITDAFEDMLGEFKDEKVTSLIPTSPPIEWEAAHRAVQGAGRRRAPESRFPQDVNAQLWGAVGAVIKSWQSARAITYRKLNEIPDGWGTAVNVQAMVFGNMGDTSATGVAFTRNPSTGTRELLWRIPGQCAG